MLDATVCQNRIHSDITETSAVESLSLFFRIDCAELARINEHFNRILKNCRKYDLDRGYRLITLQRGSTIYVPFLGPHDECQRWLENNSRLNGIVTGHDVLDKAARAVF